MYASVLCVTLFSSCTVSTYTRYNNVSWRSVPAFTNDPLPMIGQEYFIKLVKCKFQGGWFIQFKIQYQLRILKVPKTKHIKTLGDKTFARVAIGPSLWNTLPSSYQEYPECSGFQAGAKDLFVSFGICPMNQFVYSDCGVLFSFSLSVLFVMC